MSLLPREAIENIYKKKKCKLTFWRHFQMSISPRILVLVGGVFHSLKAPLGSHYYVWNMPFMYVKNHNFSDRWISLDWGAQMVQLQVKCLIVMLWQMNCRHWRSVWSSLFMWMGYKLLMISTRSHLAIFWVKINRWKIRSQKCHIFRQYALFKSEIGDPCQKIHAKESCDFWEKKKRLRKICMEKTGWRVGSSMSN